eukprot:6178501-Pyramimonas_sp.AAC.1
MCIRDRGWSPHSPRSGWATDSRAEGASFAEIREGGRWVSDFSLRIHLDVRGARRHAHRGPREAAGLGC